MIVNETKKPKTVFQKFLKVVLLLFGLIVLGILFLAISLNHRLQRQADLLPEAIERAKHEGMWLTPADLKPKTQFNESQNAAHLYDLAAEEKDKDKINVDDYDTAFAILKPNHKADNKAAALKILTRRKKLMDIADKAVKLPICYFEKNYNDPINIHFKEFALSREIARLYSMKAVLQSDSGDWQSSFNSLDTAIKAAMVCTNTNLEMSLLVRAACFKIIDKAFEQIINKNYTNNDFIKKAYLTYNHFGKPFDVRDYMPYELLFSRSAVGKDVELRSMDPTYVIFKRIKPILSNYNKMREAYVINYFVEAKKQITNSNANYTISNSILMTLQNKEEKRLADSGNLYELLILPSFGNVELKYASCEARHRLLFLHLKLMEYKNRHGQFPAVLNTKLHDPFTNKLFIYKLSHNSFKLYSVGENLSDDGGTEQMDANKHPKDIVVSYP